MHAERKLDQIGPSWTQIGPKLDPLGEPGFGSLSRHWDALGTLLLLCPWACWTVHQPTFNLLGTDASCNIFVGHFVGHFCVTIRPAQLADYRYTRPHCASQKGDWERQKGDWEGKKGDWERQKRRLGMSIDFTREQGPHSETSGQGSI